MSDSAEQIIMAEVTEWRRAEMALENALTQDAVYETWEEILSAASNIEDIADRIQEKAREQLMALEEEDE
jgi:hypothetical protein